MQDDALTGMGGDASYWDGLDPSLRRHIDEFLNAVCLPSEGDAQRGFCLHCGNLLGGGERHCPTCGHDVRDDAGQAAAPATVASIPMGAAPSPAVPSMASPVRRGQRGGLDLFGPLRRSSRREGRSQDGSSAREMSAAFRAQEEAAPASAPEGLRAWLDAVDEPFTTTLLRLIDERGLNDVEVYKRAHLSRQLFSRIRSDANYRPAKKTVLALAVAMGLDVQETRDLLERAGFALSRASKRDVIVEYFITSGIWDLLAINQALYEYDQPLL